MPVSSTLRVLLAMTPILVILALMLIARWSAARAGVLGLLVTLAIALGVFGYGREVYPGIGPVWATAGALAEAVSTAFTILWIIFPALLIHQLQERTGAIEVLRRSLGRLTGDPRMVALLIGWFFALFFEGAAGFGTPIALTAPFLVSVGFDPAMAVAVALIGHSVGVSFGAIGAPALPLIAAAGFDGVGMSRAIGLYHLALGWVMPLILMGIIRRHLPAGKSQVRGIWGWTLLAGVLFLIPFYLIAYWVGPELPSMGGGLIGGAVFVMLLRYAERHTTIAPDEGDPLPVGRLIHAAAPYLALVLLILATRLIPPLRQALTDVVWEWSLFGVFSGNIRPLYQPGTMLFAAFVLGALWQRPPWSAVRGSFTATVSRLGGVTVALLAMLSLSRLMVHAGLTGALAVAAAATAGGLWPLFSPFVGVLGTFITGSATASNILFAEFQLATATDLQLPLLRLLGTQGFGAAVGNIICPHNIIAGGATVGLGGREGEVLRRTLWPCLLYASLGGIMALLLVTAGV
jgi:lactate permease